MRNATLTILIALCAGMLSGQYTIDIREASWHQPSSPMMQMSVSIRRAGSAPFSGELVLTSIKPGGERVSYSLAVSMAEGVREGVYRFEVPTDANAGNFSVELYKGTDRTDPVAQQMVQSGGSSGMFGSLAIGFISRSRMAMLNGSIGLRMVEIPITEAPENWRPLAGFRAIVLNDDRISRSQARALIDYATAGGTLIIAPRSAASFNPETPAGKLFLIKSTTAPIKRKLSDFSALIQELSDATVTPPLVIPDESEGCGSEKYTDEMLVLEDEFAEMLTKPAINASVTLWTQSGRSVPVEGITGADGLISRARVGVGHVVLIHVDISEEPFSTGSDSRPTQALANLVNIVMQKIGVGNPHGGKLGHKQMSRFIDIASKQIPGRAFMLISLFAYLLFAGVGLYMLARKIKRPEYYPIGLLVFAIISVITVFGGSELLKRSGEKVKAVRVIFADESTNQTAVIDLACAYHMDGETHQMQSGTTTLFAPTGDALRLSDWGASSFDMDVQGNEAKYEMLSLDRWQNIFYQQFTPAEGNGVKGVVITEQDGSWKVFNRGSKKISSLIVGINTGERSSFGGPTSRGPDPLAASSGTIGLRWFFIPSLDAGQSKNVSRKDPVLPANAALVREMIEANSGDEAEAMLALLDFDRGGWRVTNMNYRLQTLAEFMGTSRNIGEFVVLATLPADTLPVKSLSAVDVDDDEIEQHVLLISTGIVKE